MMTSFKGIGQRHGRTRVLAISGACLATLLGALAWVFRSQPDPEGLRREAGAALKAQRFDQALSPLDQLARRRPLSSTERLMRAEAFVGLGRLDEALTDLAQVPDAEPLAARARFAEGDIELWRRHRTRAAEKALRRSLELDPKDVDSRRDLIRLYDIQGRVTERDRHYRILAEDIPLSLDDLLAWCRVKRPDGEANEVVILLRRFVEGDPEDDRSRLELARHLQRTGRLEEAEHQLSRLPETDPNVVAVRALIAIDHGDEKACEDWLARSSGSSAVFLRLRGQRALLKHDAHAALRFYQAAHESEPGSRDTIFGLGQSYRLVGDAAAAKSWIDRGARLNTLEALVQQAVSARNSRDPDLINRIGGACEVAGHLDQARAWYRFCLGIDPLNRAAQQAVYRLGPGNKERPARDRSSTGPEEAGS
jgi:tetratricopeptide (TPR) repeat protein